MLDNFLPVSVRASAVLTDAYVAGTVIDNAQEYNQLAILAKWTKGSLTSLEIKVEFSLDGTDYFCPQNGTVSTTTTSLVPNNWTTTTEGNLYIEVPISTRYIKISSKGTGTVTNSLLAVTGLLHVV
jgi:hypothetical protein